MTALPDVPSATVTIHSWNLSELTGDRPQSKGIPKVGKIWKPLSGFGLSVFDPLVPGTEFKLCFERRRGYPPRRVSGVLFTFEQAPDEVGLRCLLAEVPATPLSSIALRAGVGIPIFRAHCILCTLK